MKSMGFEKIQLFNPQLVKNVAQQHIRVIADYANGRVAFKGLDANGRMMRKYTQKYAMAKATGFKRKRGKISKKTGRRLKARGSTLGVAQKSYQTHPPNLVLTGRTLRSLRMKIFFQDRYCIGWSGEEGAILEGQAKHGRDIVSGIPQAELEWCQDKFRTLIDQELNKLHDVNIKI